MRSKPDGDHSQSGLAWSDERSPVPAPDPVEHPRHYTNHPSEIECIQITEHMNFCRGQRDQIYLARRREGAGGRGLEKSTVVHRS